MRTGQQSLHFQGADLAIVNFLDAAAGLSWLLITVFRRVAVGTGVWWCCCCRGKRFVLRDGRLFALYMSACLTVGRWRRCAWTTRAAHPRASPERLTSLIVFAGAVTYLILRRPRITDHSDRSLPAGAQPAAHDRVVSGNNHPPCVRWWHRRGRPGRLI
jgi:hypothetical protein